MLFEENQVNKLFQLNFHDCLTDTVAILLIAIYDPRQCDHFAFLELHGLWKRGDLAGQSVVADRVGVVQSTLAHVCVAPFCGHALIGIEVATGNGNDDSVDVV